MQEYFSEIEYPRHAGYVKHKLTDVLTIVMCAVMCKMTELCEIMV
ncbi:MAG: transposase family protein, partial [Selenomonadaceae bacterium]|nr:transposase family protein [Selenomonadaceae bacterium]